MFERKLALDRELVLEDAEGSLLNPRVVSAVHVANVMRPKCAALSSAFSAGHQARRDMA